MLNFLKVFRKELKNAKSRRCKYLFTLFLDAEESTVLLKWRQKSLDRAAKTAILSFVILVKGQATTPGLQIREASRKFCLIRLKYIYVSL